MAVSQEPTLALDAAAFGEAKGLRRGEDIVDSLAYIDTISAAEKNAAEDLIKEEVLMNETKQRSKAKSGHENLFWSGTEHYQRLAMSLSVSSAWQVKQMNTRPADYLKELPKMHQVRFEVRHCPT